MNEVKIHQQEMICALATATGVGAIAVVRLSGEGSIALTNRFFKGSDLNHAASHTIHFGTIRDNDQIIDEVLVSVFRTPNSFTKEDSVEISCHGSDYIVRQILKLLITNGARIAKPGEFTQRAFMNGQFDLVQAEAVADLIAADSEASHKTALNQLRGGFSKKLDSLRTELIHFASLIELELDFGEEDVEFAERDDLRKLITTLLQTVTPLIDSFDFGNAIKEGFPVAIIGSPNVGKSTLLNALLNEEKAIVTSIAGTTRDVIEDTIVMGGLKFRFIDTAGIRETTDLVESIGIERSKQAMEKADIVVFLYDSEETFQDLQVLANGIGNSKKVLWVKNKVDNLTVRQAAPEPRENHLTPQPPLLTGEREVDRTTFTEGNQQEEFPSPPRRGVRGEVSFKPLYTKIPPEVLENARNLRQSETNAEVLLWGILRNRRFHNLKFRRQHPLEEGFVIDLFCPEFRLGIELDGDVHLEKEQSLFDKQRTKRLKELYNIDIIRFKNEEVFEDLERVLNQIGEFVASSGYNHLTARQAAPEPRENHLTPQPPLLTGEGEVNRTTFTEGNQQEEFPSPPRRGVRGEVIRNEVMNGAVQLSISAKTQLGLENLKSTLVEMVKTQAASDTVVSNSRHYEHLLKTKQALDEVLHGLNTGITGDFLAQDIRLSLHHLGEITGTIVTDDLLDNIFSKFCIGK